MFEIIPAVIVAIFLAMGSVPGELGSVNGVNSCDGTECNQSKETDNAPRGGKSSDGADADTAE